MCQIQKDHTNLICSSSIKTIELDNLILFLRKWVFLGECSTSEKSGTFFLNVRLWIYVHFKTEFLHRKTIKLIQNSKRLNQWHIPNYYKYANHNTTTLYSNVGTHKFSLTQEFCLHAIKLTRDIEFRQNKTILWFFNKLHHIPVYIKIFG